MRKVKVWVGFLLLVFAPFAVYAASSIRIGASHDYLDDGKNTFVKRIRNTGDSTAFVRVSTVELTREGDGKWRERDAKNSVQPAPGFSPALVASPDRLIIPAGGTQVVRLLYTGERAEERYFRVRFEPVHPSDKNGFSADNADEYRRSIDAGVNVLTGYGSVVFVAPENPRYETRVERQGNSMLVRNDGNASVVLHYFYECAVTSKQCVSLGKHHILPKTQREFSMRDGYEYRFTLQEGKRERKLDFSF